MRHPRITIATLAAAAIVAGAACGPPAATGGQTRMANTPANVAKCNDWDGTAIRDPQPPRPASDPGPYFICVIPNRAG
jgi:hypothetical protein